MFWFQGVAGTPAPAARAGTAPTARSASPLRLIRSEPRPTRAARLLSPAQREALQQLIGLGARLDETFTLQELRSEFRALARLYHPDRQAARSVRTPQSAAAFVTLRRAYDALKTAA